VTVVRKATLLSRDDMKVAFLTSGAALPGSTSTGDEYRRRQVGATSYRARRRVNDAVPDVIARRSTA